MNEALTVMTRKGQITVPAGVRKALGLKRGDKVAISISHGSKQAILRPVRSVAEMTFGSVTPRKRPPDIGELRRAFEAAVVEEARAEHEQAPSDEQ